MKAVTSFAVTFPPAERTIAETLTLLTDQLSRVAGKKIVLMSQPFRLGLNERIVWGANGDTFGDALEKLGATIGGTLTYQCLYDASDATYYINIYPVSAPTSSILAYNKAPGETSTLGSTFFTKDLPE